MDNKTFSFSVGLGEGRIPASQMKNMKFHYTPIPFDLKEIEDFTKEIGQVVQHEYGLNNVNMSIKYGFFEDWGKTAKNSGGSANKTAGKYISTEKRLDVYMDSIWGRTLNRHGANPTIDQFKEEISNTVAHELRHQWQFENKEGAASDLWKQQDEYVDSLANKYSSINQLTRNDYLNHPIEIDARDYGNKIQATYKEKINNYRNMMNSTATSEKSKQRKLKNANKSYRPEVKMNGNNLEIDSIYNHSVPKKINKSPKQRLTPEEQLAVDKANEQWRLEVEQRNRQMDQEIEDMLEETKKMFATDEELMDPNYVSKFEPEENPTSKSPKTIEQENATTEQANDVSFDANDTSTWSDEDIERIRQTDPDYAAELEELRKNNTVNTPQPKAFDVEDPSTWTDEDLLNIKNTDPDYYNELMELRNQGVPNTPNSNIPKTQSSTNTPNVDPELEKARINKERAEEAYRKAMEQINSKPDVEKIKSTKQTREFANKNANAENFAKNNFDELDDGKINKKTRYTGEYTANTKYTDNNGNIIKTRRTVKNASDAADAAKNVSKAGLVTTGINVINTIGDYKDERRKGHGMVSSAVRAGAKFAMYEALGLWSIPVALVSNVPGAVIKGADMLYKENRRMNSAANFEAFGGAQFMDTQQLATMRQSGMEMAKMANYNLQQTLMGNEATYLHR